MRAPTVVLFVLAPLLLGADSPTATDWLEKGFRHARSRETNKERAAYRRALHLDPGLTEAHGALGMSNYTAKGGSMDTVVTEIREYLLSSPHRDHLAKAIALWEIYGEARRFRIVLKDTLDSAKKAEGPAGAELLERAAAGDVAPVHRTRLWLMAGERRLEAGDRDRARADFAKAAEGVGGRIRMDARLRLAALDVADDRPVEALAHLRAAVEEGSLACRLIRERKATDFRKLFEAGDSVLRAALRDLTDERYGDRAIRAEIRGACERAGKEKKKVLLLWYGPYCPYVMLLEERLAHPRIRKLVAMHFVLVRMNQGQLHRGLTLEIEYGDVMKAHGVPSFHVLSADGTMHSVMKDGPLMDVPHRRFSVAKIAAWLQGLATD